MSAPAPLAACAVKVRTVLPAVSDTTYLMVAASDSVRVRVRVSSTPSPLGVKTGSWPSAGCVPDSGSAVKSLIVGGVVSPPSAGTVPPAAAPPLVEGELEITGDVAEIAEVGVRVHVDGRAGRADGVEVEVGLPADPPVPRLVLGVAVGLVGPLEEVVHRAVVGQQRAGKIRAGLPREREDDARADREEARRVVVDALERDVLVGHRHAGLGVARRVAEPVEQHDRVRREMDLLAHLVGAVVA